MLASCIITKILQWVSKSWNHRPCLSICFSTVDILLPINTKFLSLFPLLYLLRQRFKDQILTLKAWERVFFLISSWPAEWKHLEMWHWDVFLQYKFSLLPIALIQSQLFLGYLYIQERRWYFFLLESLEWEAQQDFVIYATFILVKLLQFHLVGIIKKSLQYTSINGNILFY